MADAPKAKPSNPLHDFLWFIGIMIGFFFLWVWGGGPERARQNPPSPVIQNGPAQVSPNPNPYGTPSGSSSQGNPSPSPNPSSGSIEVTPL